MLMRLILAVALLCVQAYSQEDNPKVAIMAVEQARIAALLSADTIALDTILAGEYALTDHDGIAWTKREFLADLADGKLTFDSLQPVTDDIIVYDQTATVTGRFRGTVITEGVSRTFEAKHLRVYVYHSNRWQLVAHQMTRVGTNLQVSAGSDK